jgi:UDP-glucose 4-epimerase
VRGTILAGEKLEGDIVNIGNNHEITILKLAETIIKLTNSKSKIKFVPKEKVFKQKFDGAKRRVPNVNKAMSLIGFEAKTSLEEGLRKTIDWTKTQI